MASSPCPTIFTSHQSITTLLPDIIETHILTRLDGQTLAAAACTSSHLHSLCTQEKLWQHICSSTWPSSNDPRVQTLVSSYPGGGHRSFCSDSFPVLDCQKQPSKRVHDDDSLLVTEEIISAVDLYYRNDPAFSRVSENETVTGWFQFPPFRIDLVDANDSVLTKIPFVSEANILFEELEKNLTLSWIIIDSSRNRAVNLSSRWPVSLQEDWLTGDLHVKYAVVIAAAGNQQWGLFSAREWVECEVLVTLGGREEKGEEMLYVKEVNMEMKDMEGRNLSGRDSLVILQRVMDSGKRKRGRREEVKERYEEFLMRKIDRKEKKKRAERTLNNVCLASGFFMFVAFWAFKVFQIREKELFMT